MDEQAQKAGEARVRQLLIEPLIRLGLTRPGSMTLAVFEAMQHEVCQRMAYMTATGLGALAEDMSGRGGGKDRDRFPLAVRILERALVIEPPPGGDASPLMRNVFAHRVGADALREGWAPELLKWVAANRSFPGSYVLGQIASAAREHIREHERLVSADRSGVDLSSSDRALLERRREAIARCETARALGLADRTKGGVVA